MPQYTFSFDSNRCLKCHACEAACKVENRVHVGHGVGSDGPKGPRYRRVHIIGTGKETFQMAQGPGQTLLSMSCNHCEAPMCWHACPLKGKDLYDVSGAIYKERTVGAVVINNGKFGTPAVCNGCRKCEAGCPYGAPQWNPVSSKVEKCHLCVLTRLKRPDSDGISRPACVDICGGRALQVTDNAAQPYKLVRKMKGRYKGASPDPADGGLTKFVEVVEGIPQSEQRPGEFTKELTVVGEMAPALTKPNFVVRPRCGRYSEIKG